MVKKCNIMVCVCALLLSSCWRTATVTEPDIVPEPMFMVQKEGTYVLERQMSLAVSGVGQNSPTVKYIMKSLRHAHMRPSLVALSEESDILLRVNDTVNPELGEEGYLLEVRSDGVTLSANTEVGLFYAYQTLIQMLPPDVLKTTFKSVVLPECTVLDRPRFDWRGLHVNVSGSPMPVKTLKRVADVMATYKMNRLCIDGSRWNEDSLRWEVDSLAVYSPDDADELTGYAASLGITVLWDSLPPLAFSQAECLARARHGEQLVLEDIEHWDLSCFQGDPRYQPTAHEGVITLGRTYQFDPLPMGTNRHTAASVLGGQCRLLTDCVVDLGQTEYMLLPRLLAVAENLWTPGDKRSWKSFRKRVESQKERLSARGYGYCEGSFTPLFNATKVDERTMNVAIETEVPNTYIFYTTDNSTPTRASAIYLGPVNLERGTHIKILPVYKDIVRDSVYEFVIR